MIKDISIIREHLVGFAEVFPDSYEFQKNEPVQYISLTEDDEESFHTGGLYVGLGNNSIILRSTSGTWTVPITELNKDGSVRYRSKFFVKENFQDETQNHPDIQKLRDIIDYQQTIIEKLSKTLKDLEISKHELLSENQSYIELLEQNRHNLKDLSLKFREQSSELAKSKDIIQKLSQSHPLMR